MTIFPALFRRSALALIRFYQRTLSVNHGLASFVVSATTRCRFYPSCSDYGYRAIERFGLWRGGFLTLRRVLRCHPFSRGGVDEVPKLGDRVWE
ncbi:membrane protein insertion efficiency factor YidD [Patescibacteria group bacterium]|nr:MAG: membrane protein insertion efficiency factor YidD [Patescibacteria group bacterium]